MSEKYYNKDSWIMVNHSVNEFYTQFLFTIDALPQDVGFPLDITATFFNNLSTDEREFLISEGVQVTPSPTTETSTQGNHRILWVRNTAMEAEK